MFGRARNLCKHCFCVSGFEVVKSLHGNVWDVTGDWGVFIHLAFLCTLCMPKVQGLKKNEKHLALSFREVVALGTFVLCKTGTCGRFLRTITQL